MTPPESSSSRTRWREVSSPSTNRKLRSSSVLCSDPRTLEVPCLGLYREGPLRALVQVAAVELEPDLTAWLTPRILSQSCPPGRSPAHNRTTLRVSAQLPDGMNLLWRLWQLTSSTAEAGRLEAAERHLISPLWSWWVPEPDS